MLDGCADERAHKAALGTLRRMVKQWPFFSTLLSNMDMVLSRRTAVASRYASVR